MKPYVLALAVGALVGGIHGPLGVRSPAPPMLALLGLLGMLLGEQVVPAARRVLSGEGLTAAWFTRECAPKITGAPAAEERGE